MPRGTKPGVSRLRARSPPPSERRPRDGETPVKLSKNPTIAFIFLVFFVISFLTNILGPLVPDIISGFKVSLAMAAVLPFSFFIAYGVMSIPAGFLVERWGEKRSMVAAMGLACGGALAFAAVPTYGVAVAS